MASGRSRGYVSLYKIIVQRSRTFITKLNFREILFDARSQTFHGILNFRFRVTYYICVVYIVIHNAVIQFHCWGFNCEYRKNVSCKKYAYGTTGY